MINILTDSCSDLTPELLARYQIHTIPLNVFINNTNYRDGVDLKQTDLFRLVEEGGALPKTSAPSVAAFTNLYNSLPGDHVFVGIGARFSATVQNATLAAQEVSGHDVRVIDSANLSSSIGHLAIRAAELRDQGLSLDEIEARLQGLAPKLRTIFVIDRMDYLHMGGRCSSMQLVVGSLLKIRPVIEVRADGTMGVKDRSSGSRKKALDYLVNEFKKHLAEIDLRRVFLSQATCLEDAEYIRERLLALAPVEEVLITDTGAVVSSHCGPKTVSLLYMTK